MSTSISRNLGDSELSYYLPSREDGVSDMYLRLSVRIHEDIFTPERLQIAWSILQIRNPLLAVRIESNYETTFGSPLPPVSGEAPNPKKFTPLEARFHYDIPQSSAEAITRVKKHVSLIAHPELPIRDFLAKYLDGPRTLSDSMVCKLLVIHAHPEDAEGPDHFPIPSEEERNAQNPYNPHPKPYQAAHLILLCAHFIGDAGSIQFISKDLMYLLSFPTEELERVLEREVDELKKAVGASEGDGSDFKGTSTLLPASLEGRLPPIRGRFKNVLSKMEFMKWQSRMIGGQGLPKKEAPNPLSFLMASKPSTSAPTTSTSAPTGLLTPPTHPGSSSSTGTHQSFPFHSTSPPKSLAASISTTASGLSTSAPSERSGSEPSTAPSSIPPSPTEKTSSSSLPILPTHPARRIPTHTRTHELILSKERTAKILATCKREGVTISTALFAVVGAAWGEMVAAKAKSASSSSSVGGNDSLPILLYSARNMRPYLPPKAPKSLSGSGLKEGKGYKGWESYYYLSLSYFNVILPLWVPDASSSSSSALALGESSTPTELALKVFWHRARLARKQARGPNVESLTDIVRFVSRTWQMGRARREGAEGFAVNVLRKIREVEGMMKAKAEMEKKAREGREGGVGLGITAPGAGLGVPRVAVTGTAITSPTPSIPNARLSALRPTMPMRMPSAMAVPQEFPPSPPLTPGQTPTISRTSSSLQVSSVVAEEPKEIGEKEKEKAGEVQLSVPASKDAQLKPSEEAQAQAHRNPLSARFLPPKVPATALLGLSLLGSFDPLFPPPNQKIDHLYPSAPSSESTTTKSPSEYDPATYAPFEPISLGAGCRLKPGGSLLYAYTYDAQLTVVLGYDTGPMGLVNDAEGVEGIEGLWKGIVKGIGKWLEEGKMDKSVIEAGQKITASG